MLKYNLEKITRVILSPGVPTDCEEIKEFQNRNVPIWGEIELYKIISFVQLESRLAAAIPLTPAPNTKMYSSFH